MNFSRIPGHQETKTRLIRSVSEQRVSHAQLFSGPEGCGSLALALAYARYVSCENPDEQDSCGTCKSCVKHEKMIHPDVHFVFPVVRGKKDMEPISDSFIGEWRDFVARSPYFNLNDWLYSIEVGNAQGLIYSSEAAEIIKKLSLKTYESDIKTMIIWLPEKMHLVTANKLLKIIEEPPDKTLFLLVSDEPDKIIPTILSRCQHIKIPRFPNDEISNFLVSNFNYDSLKASETARVANGNLIRAIHLAKDEESSVENLDYFKSMMRFAWKRDVSSIINWSEEMAMKGREAQKGFIVYALRILRENLMLTLGQQKNNLVFMAGDEVSFSEKFHPFINKKNIYHLTDEFNLAFSHIEANGNARIIFLDLALKVVKLIR
jgi:DNA polymerase-3 subunit delta'